MKEFSLNRFGIIRIIILMFLLVFISNTSFALTKGFEAISLYPATDGGPYIGIWGSKNLDQWQWETGTLGVCICQQTFTTYCKR